jgi:tetratricopeptide (TPR) repeat protein
MRWRIPDYKFPAVSIILNWASEIVTRGKTERWRRGFGAGTEKADPAPRAGWPLLARLRVRRKAKIAKETGLRRRYLEELAMVAAAFAFLLVPCSMRAQAPADPNAAQEPAGAPPPPPAAPPAGKKGPAKARQDTATQSAPDQPTWDPLRAEKDMEVGHYYMNKGDIDAAIDRFEDAIVAKPGFAIPFYYLGEAQEKKGQKRQALKAYKRYLELYPHAEDTAKVQKKIDKLYKEVEKEKK